MDEILTIKVQANIDLDFSIRALKDGNLNDIDLNYLKQIIDKEIERFLEGGGKNTIADNVENKLIEDGYDKQRVVEYSYAIDIPCVAPRK